MRGGSGGRRLPPPCAERLAASNRGGRRPSGSGKTTLMDLLAGRKTVGTLEGQVKFSGNAPSQMFLRRFTGYVEQFGASTCWLFASCSIAACLHFLSTLPARCLPACLTSRAATAARCA